VIPEPCGDGGLPGEAGALRPHPPAGSRHLSGMGPHTTQRPRSHDGSPLARSRPFRRTAQWRKGGRIRVGSSTATPSAVRAWQRPGWHKDHAERDARHSHRPGRRPACPWHGHVARSVVCRTGRRGSTSRRGAMAWTGDDSTPSASPPAARGPCPPPEARARPSPPSWSTACENIPKGISCSIASPRARPTRTPPAVCSMAAWSMAACKAAVLPSPDSPTTNRQPPLPAPRLRGAGRWRQPPLHVPA
jgi:hypothetical protein